MNKEETWTHKDTKEWLLRGIKLPHGSKTKQEEIREGIKDSFLNWKCFVHEDELRFTESQLDALADKILQDMKDKGVVIKVDRECERCDGAGKHNFYSITYKSDIDTVCNYCKGVGSLKAVEELI